MAADQSGIVNTMDGLHVNSVKTVAGAELSADADAPATNGFVIYAKDSGGGKTQLCVRFATGAVQVLATEP